jgi:hypothetical protein
MPETARIASLLLQLIVCNNVHGASSFASFAPYSVCGIVGYSGFLSRRRPQRDDLKGKR